MDGDQPVSKNDKMSSEETQDTGEEEKRRSEEERQQALQTAEELRVKVQQKIDFHDKNTKAVDRMGEDQLRRYDGSIKKNTAFAKKLRELTEAKREALTKDFESLNLSNYILEVATSIAEAKLKLADVGCAVHISSLIHCRYSEFSGVLMDQLQRIYSVGIDKDEDKGAVSTKYRTGLRLLGELVISGIVVQDIGIALLSDMLSNIITADKETHVHIAVVTSFARQFADDYAGFSPRKNKTLFAKYGIEPPQAKLIPQEKQALFHTLLFDYFMSVKQYLIQQHKGMHKRARRNRQILQSKGELSVERQDENEKMQKAYEKLVNSTSTLSDILDLDMPDLPEDQIPQDISGISIDIQLPSIGSDEEFSSSSLWEDEDQRSFYKDITDITPFIPAILYEGSKRKNTESESSDTSTGEGEVPKEGEEIIDEQDEPKLIEEMIQEAENLTLEEMEEEDDSQPLEEPVELQVPSTESGGTPEPNQFDELVTRLPNMMNRKFVNEFAVEFCLHMNTKLNRQKLAKILFNVDKNRMDLVPFYARLIKTLHPCVSELPIMISDMLMRDFRFQIRKKDQIYIHTKIKNARFIAELTKFDLCAKAETMKCITLTLQDFTHHNVELACTFIEHCGRYLLRSHDSHLRAKALLEIMMRKKQVQHLDGRQKSLVEDALYAANPPEVKPTLRVLRPPLQEYIIKLLYKDLNKLNTEKILKQFRKLPWTDLQVFQWAVQALTEVWNVKFSNIHCVANLLAGLNSYQEEATIWVVDGVLEDIRLGLEINESRMNQRRVSMIKYLGELYNYQLIESNVIFRSLYTLLSFGCNPDGSPGPLDPFDSYFRVRLVCVLLDTCGMYFDHGSSKKKLDTFIIFFQCYLFKKRQPLPLEVEYMVTDTLLAIQPNLILYSTPMEAAEAAGEIEKKFRSKFSETGDEGEGGEESDEEEEGGLLEGGSQEDYEEEEEEEEEVEDDEEEEGDEDENQIIGQDEFEDEDVGVLNSGPKQIQCVEDDEFMAAFDKMITESRKVDSNVKIPSVDVAIPMHLRGVGLKTHTDETGQEQDGQYKKFTLVTKKGHKQQLKDLHIPIDSNLASGLRDTQQALKAEQLEMKKLVLTHERRQEEEDYQAAMLVESQSQVKIQTHSGNIHRPISHGPQHFSRQHHSYHHSNRQRPHHPRKQQDRWPKQQ